MTPQPDILSLKPPAPTLRTVYGGDPNQVAHLWLPASRGPHPTVVFVHGGFWRAAYSLEHAGHLCDALRQSGLAVVSLEYRRIGQSGGGWPGTLDDIRRGTAHVGEVAARHGLDLERCAVSGHSAGGQLALILAAEAPIPLRGVVALAPVADLRRAWELELGNRVVAEFLGGSPQEHQDRYREASPVDRAPFRTRVRLIHGADDRIVPVELSRRLAAAAREAGDDVCLVEPAGCGHFELIDPRTPHFAAVRDALVSLVR